MRSDEIRVEEKTLAQVMAGPEECVVLPDGRVAHFFRSPGGDGIRRCSRCAAVSGRHGYQQAS